MTDGTTLKERIDAALEAGGYHLVSARRSDIPLRRPSLGIVTLYNGMTEDTIGRLVPSVIVYVERPLLRNEGTPDMERDVTSMVDILNTVPNCFPEQQDITIEEDDEDGVVQAVITCLGV